MHLFSRLCCKLCVCIIRIEENSVMFRLYVKAGCMLEVWMGVIFRLLQGQTLSTAFVTAVLF